MIAYQTVVHEKAKGGRTGIVCPAAPLMEDEPGITVIFPPSTVSEVIDADTVEVIGPENAFADFDKCGAGKGVLVCKFLVIGTGKAQCSRFSEGRWGLIFNSPNLRRLRQPTEAYPNCQLKL